MGDSGAGGQVSAVAAAAAALDAGGGGRKPEGNAGAVAAVAARLDAGGGGRQSEGDAGDVAAVAGRVGIQGGSSWAAITSCRPLAPGVLRVSHGPSTSCPPHAPAAGFGGEVPHGSSTWVAARPPDSIWVHS